MLFQISPQKNKIILENALKNNGMWEPTRRSAFLLFAAGPKILKEVTIPYVLIIFRYQSLL